MRVDLHSEKRTGRRYRMGSDQMVVPWRADELAVLRIAYGNATTNEAFDLDAIAKMLGRAKTNVSRKARLLGLTNIRRAKVAAPKPATKYPTIVESRAAIGAATKQRIAEKGHPRGALGLQHSPEAREKMAAASRNAWANPASKFNSEAYKQHQSDAMAARQNDPQGELRTGGHTRCRGGRREDIGNRYFRSAWEANYARYLHWLVERKEIASWEYECKTFEFTSIKRGTRSYTPDFKVTATDGTYVWHEVKGWMDQPSRTRLDRMARYYPDEQVIVVDAAWFKSANKTLPGLIANWEGGTTR